MHKLSCDNADGNSSFAFCMCCNRNDRNSPDLVPNSSPLFTIGNLIIRNGLKEISGVMNSDDQNLRLRDGGRQYRSRITSCM